MPYRNCERECVSPEACARDYGTINSAHYANDMERERRALNGYNYVQAFPDQEGICGRIEEFIRQRIKEREPRRKAKTV